MIFEWNIDITWWSATSAALWMADLHSKRGEAVLFIRILTYIKFLKCLVGLYFLGFKLIQSYPWNLEYAVHQTCWKSAPRSVSLALPFWKKLAHVFLHLCFSLVSSSYFFMQYTLTGILHLSYSCLKEKLCLRRVMYNFFFKNLTDMWKCWHHSWIKPALG